jgi:hypothetical protein
MQTLEHLSEPAFKWLNFWEYFDIRNACKSQGDYAKSLNIAFAQLETHEQKTRLLTLLDLQLIIQLELIHATKLETGAYEDENADDLRQDTLDARLQINDNIRTSLSLPTRPERLSKPLNNYLEIGSRKKLSFS